MKEILEKTGFDRYMPYEINIEDYFCEVVCLKRFWTKVGELKGWKDDYTNEDPQWKNWTFEQMKTCSPRGLCLAFHEVNYNEGMKKAVEWLINFIK